MNTGHDKDFYLVRELQPIMGDRRGHDCVRTAVDRIASLSGLLVAIALFVAWWKDRKDQEAYVETDKADNSVPDHQV